MARQAPQLLPSDAGRCPARTTGPARTPPLPGLTHTPEAVTMAVPELPAESGWYRLTGHGWEPVDDDVA